MESPTEGSWDGCIGWKGNGFIRVSQVEAELAKRVLYTQWYFGAWEQFLVRLAAQDEEEV